MWTYLIVFTKVIFSLMSRYSSEYNFSMLSVHMPLNIWSDLFIGIRLAASDFGLDGNAHIILTLVTMAIIRLLWIVIAILLLVGLFSPQTKKVGFGLSCIALLVECITSLFIYNVQTMAYYFAVNLILFIISVITLFRSKA